MFFDIVDLVAGRKAMYVVARDEVWENFWVSIDRVSLSCVLMDKC